MKRTLIAAAFWLAMAGTQSAIAQAEMLSVVCIGQSHLESSPANYFSGTFKVDFVQPFDVKTIEVKFYDAVKVKYAPEEFYTSDVHCDTALDPAKVERRRQLFLSQTGKNIRAVNVDWPVGKQTAAPPSKTAKPATSPGYLVVKDNGEAARAKAWDNAVLQAKRERAAARVKAAVATAEAKAEYDLIIAKAIEDAKNRSNIQ